MRALALMLLSLLISCKAAADQQIKLHGMEQFSATEQKKLGLWLQQSSDASSHLLGPFPFQIDVYLSRHTGNEPVPWAYTQRMDQQQVFFQVNSSFSLAEFQQDWTAAHEFSHVALPLLDRHDLWFAEGFASFMQYQILQQQQQLNLSPSDLYQQKLQQLAPLLADSTLPFVSQLQLWLQQRQYKAAYWGSALFFIEADWLLQQRGSSLSILIKRYQRQNRLVDQNLRQLIHSLDSLVGEPVFATLLYKYQRSPSQQLWRQHPAYFKPTASTTP